VFSSGVVGLFEVKEPQPTTLLLYKSFSNNNLMFQGEPDGLLYSGVGVNC